MTDDAAQPPEKGPGEGRAAGSELDSNVAGGDGALGPEEVGAEDEDFDAPAGASGDEAERRRAPWHFKIILVGTVIYLGYRSYQGIEWLIHHV